MCVCVCVCGWGGLPGSPSTIPTCTLVGAVNAEAPCPGNERGAAGNLKGLRCPQDIRSAQARNQLSWPWGVNQKRALEETRGQRREGEGERMMSRATLGSGTLAPALSPLHPSKGRIPLLLVLTYTR